MHYVLTRTMTDLTHYDVQSETICISSDKTLLRKHLKSVSAITKSMTIVQQSADRLVVKLTPDENKAPDYIAYSINPYNKPIDIEDNSIYAHVRNANKVTIPGMGISQLGAEIGSCIKIDDINLAIGLLLSIVNSVSRKFKISVDDLLFCISAMYLENKSNMGNAKPAGDEDGNDDDK